jgi:hypothetical protein
MALSSQHGKSTVITVATFDLSQFTKNSSIERNPDIHDTTGYTVDDALNQGGLKRGTFNMSGVYDTAATGPRGKLLPLHATTVVVTRKPEGTGSGKPLETFSAVVGKYVETSPHDDMVTWSQDFTLSGPVVPTVQP